MKKFYSLVTVVAVITVILGTVHLLAAPGDTNDPIITLSYINEVLIPKINQMISEGSPNSFKVLELEKGDKLILSAGTELILRMGKATVIATEKGGIANVTAAVDLADGANVPPNSHLIVPLSDGRGIKAYEKTIVMIKGSYSLEK